MQDPTKPVAYDADGNPLYAAPQVKPELPEDAEREYEPQSHVTAVPESYEGHNFNPQLRSQYANEPRIVHATREVEPEEFEISEELMMRHEKSKRMFPDLNLTAGEYVILRIKRHPIGLLLPMITTIAIVVSMLVLIIAYPIIAADTAGNDSNVGIVTLILMAVIVLVSIGGYISVWVYTRNTFYLTNESAVQEIQHGVFSRHEQTVSLGSIEDASFVQRGILQSIFDYGTMRLSTEGEETTYRFAYVANPKRQVAIVSNAVECFKNGRPVGGDVFQWETK